MNNNIIRYEDYAVIRINSNTYGIIDYKIDLDDIERCDQYVWTAMRTTLKQSKNYFYAKTEGNYGYRMLHRFIMNAPDEYVVDHINNDTTDNRKSNLRICTFQANCRNRRLSSNNTSGYTGVTWIKKSSKWMAYIHVKDKYKNLEYFNDIQDAVKARRAGEMKYFGEYITELKRLKEQAPKAS